MALGVSSALVDKTQSKQLNNVNFMYLIERNYLDMLILWD